MAEQFNLKALAETAKTVKKPGGEPGADEVGRILSALPVTACSQSQASGADDRIRSQACWRIVYLIVFVVSMSILRTAQPAVGAHSGTRGSSITRLVLETLIALWFLQLLTTACFLPKIGLQWKVGPDV